MVTPEQLLDVAIIRDPWNNGWINISPAVPVITTEGKKVRVEKVLLSSKTPCQAHLLGTETNLGFEKIQELAPDLPINHLD